jgi:hypothetical protein
MSDYKYVVRHLDETTTRHDTLEDAFREASDRMRPWMEDDDRCLMYDDEDYFSVYVFDSVGQRTQDVPTFIHREPWG